LQKSIGFEARLNYSHVTKASVSSTESLCDLVELLEKEFLGMCVQITITIKASEHLELLEIPNLDSQKPESLGKRKSG
jgi:hypothetical protein